MSHLSVIGETVVTRPIILVADDEDGIRFSMQQILIESGYDAREAADIGDIEAEALSTDLLVIDVRWPGREYGGIEEVARLAERGLPPVLFVSIYTQEEASSANADLNSKIKNYKWLEKPFQLETFRRKIDEMLRNAGRLS